MKVDTNVASKAFLFQQMNDTTIIQWHKSQAPTSFAMGECFIYSQEGRVPKEEGAPLGEGGRTKWRGKGAKCVGVGCHLSQLHNDTVEDLKGRGCHLSRGRHPL
jgi:hypothetical protein